MKDLNDYTVEQLKRLYKRFEVWAVTRNFIDLRTYNRKTKDTGKILYFNCGVDLQELKENPKLYDTPSVTAHVLWLSHIYWESIYKMKTLQDNNEKFKEKIRSVSHDVCYNIFEYFLNPHKHLEENNLKYLNNDDTFDNKYVMLHSRYPDYPSYCTKDEYFNWWTDYENGEILTFILEMHMNDDYHDEHGMATDTEMFYFIYDTLQYLSLKDLKELVKLANKNWEKGVVGAQAKNLTIYKYDLKWKLVATYNNRKDCIAQDNISASMLSLILSGQRSQCKGYHYTEGKKIGDK